MGLKVYDHLETEPNAKPPKNWVEVALEGEPPVYVEYKGRRWRLRDDTIVTYYLVKLLKRKPERIATEVEMMKRDEGGVV